MELLNGYYEYNKDNCTLATAPLFVPAQGCGNGLCFEGLCCCPDSIEGLWVSSADMFNMDYLACHNFFFAYVGFWVAAFMFWFYAWFFNWYAVYKAFTTFKALNKRNVAYGLQPKVLHEYFPFQVIFPPTLLSVWYVANVKLFSLDRIGVDIEITLLYVISVTCTIASSQESAIKQFQQLSMAEVMVGPDSSSSSARLKRGGPGQNGTGYKFTVASRVVFLLFLIAQLLIIMNAAVTPKAPDSLREVCRLAQPFVPAETLVPTEAPTALGDTLQPSASPTIAPTGTPMNDSTVGIVDAAILEFDEYLKARETSLGAFLLVVSNTCSLLYFAFNFFITQKLKKKLQEFTEELDVATSLGRAGASGIELRQSLEFMTDTVVSQRRSDVFITLLYIVFTLPPLWPHQNYLYALVTMCLVPPYIKHLKTFAGGVKFALADDRQVMIASRERDPEEVRLKAAQSLRSKSGASHRTGVQSRHTSYRSNASRSRNRRPGTPSSHHSSRPSSKNPNRYRKHDNYDTRKGKSRADRRKGERPRTSQFAGSIDPKERRKKRHAKHRKQDSKSKSSESSSGGMSPALRMQLKYNTMPSKLEMFSSGLDDDISTPKPVPLTPPGARLSNPAVSTPGPGETRKKSSPRNVVPDALYLDDIVDTDEFDLAQQSNSAIVFLENASSEGDPEQHVGEVAGTKTSSALPRALMLESGHYSLDSNMSFDFSLGNNESSADYDVDTDIEESDDGIDVLEPVEEDAESFHEDSESSLTEVKLTVLDETLVRKSTRASDSLQSPASLAFRQHCEDLL